MTKTRGLHYQKFDLHVHTPGSEDFKDPEVTAEQIVAESLSKGLRGIAVTDHHSGEWIDEIKSAAKGSGLVVFPGVEIPVIGGKNGVHVIGLFNIDKTTKDIENFLGAIGIKAGQYGKTDAIAADILKVINTIYEHQGLAVLAHSNSSKGVIGDIQGISRKTVFANPYLYAVEVTDADFSKEKAAKQTRAIDLLNGNDENYANRKLAVYQASDNPNILSSGEHDGHSLSGIGQRYSHFKVDDVVTLESIRQCFIDRDVRIRQSWEIDTTDDSKPPYLYPYVKKLSVKGGFLDGLEVEFHSGLNNILGGKGTGKSLLVELMRFAIAQEPTQAEIKEDHGRKLSKKLDKYGEVTITMIDGAGSESTFTRIYNPIENNPYVEELTNDPAQIFPVLFLSQNEIIRIAESETEQIKFIDKFFDFRSYQNRIKDLEEQLEVLDGVFAECLKAIHESRRIERQIAALKKQIETINKQLKNPVFESFEKAQNKFLGFSIQITYLKNLLKVAQGFESELEDVALPKLDKDVEGDPAIKRVNDICAGTKHAIITSIGVMNSSIKKSLEDANKEYIAYKLIYEKQKMDYEEEVKKLGGDYQALYSQREKLVINLEKLLERDAAVKAKVEKTKRINEHRTELLGILTETYASYSDERKSKCQDFVKFSNGRIQASVKEMSNVSEFSSRLLGLKKGSYMKDQEIEAISESINPREFVINLLRYDITIKDQEKPLNEIIKKVGIGLERMKQLADFLLENYEYEELLSLQYQAVPKDRPEIKVDIGESQFELLQDVSTGQKCTAMLIMALCEGTMPVVVDQPEDSLDIRSIWEDMCHKLRSGKENRQFVLTTHNSSLAVASDTDKFIILEATAIKGQCVYCGAIDTEEIKNQVITYLEGGIPTYDIKYQKYNIKEKLKP